jgi:hypothetical protein
VFLTLNDTSFFLVTKENELIFPLTWPDDLDQVLKLMSLQYDLRYSTIHVNLSLQSQDAEKILLVALSNLIYIRCSSLFHTTLLIKRSIKG